MSETALESIVEDLEDKADRYQEATNFEAKLQEYTAAASSAQSSVYGLKSRLEQMERLNGIHNEVFGEKTPPTVEDARRQARQVLDRNADDYCSLIDDGKASEYEQKVQTAKSKADNARQNLRDSLNAKQADWEDRVDTGRRILSLMSDSQQSEQLLADVEMFVTQKMWDDSRSINSLKADWQGIQRKLDQGTVADWDEFQKRHGLSDDTIAILKRLAEGENVSFDDLDRSITGELLDVKDLRNVLEVTL